MSDAPSYNDPQLIREDKLFVDPLRVRELTYTDLDGLSLRAAIVVRSDGSHILRYGGIGATPWLVSFTTVYADTDGRVTGVLPSASAYGLPPARGDLLSAYLTGELPEGLK